MTIHYEQLDGHVARITIDRPEARNSLDLYHFRDLANAWRRFRDDADDWVAIVTGVPGEFMTGADLKTYIPQITELQAQIQAGEVDEIDGCRLRDGTDAVLRSLQIYKPIIAAVDGPCVAGGMEMLGGIDIRLATERATLRGDGAASGACSPGAGPRCACPASWPSRRPWSSCSPPRPSPPGGPRARPAQRDRRPSDELADRALDWARRITANAPAGGAGDQGERAAGPGRRPARGVPDRGRAGRPGLRQRGRQGGAPRPSPRSARRSGRGR